MLEIKSTKNKSWFKSTWSGARLWSKHSSNVTKTSVTLWHGMTQTTDSRSSWWCKAVHTMPPTASTFGSRTINSQIQTVTYSYPFLDKRTVQVVKSSLWHLQSNLIMWCINLGCTCIQTRGFVEVLGSKLPSPDVNRFWIVSWKETLIFSRGGMGTELKRWVSVLWVKARVEDWVLVTVGMYLDIPKTSEVKHENLDLKLLSPSPSPCKLHCQSLPWTASPLKAIIESQTVADSQKAHWRRHVKLGKVMMLKVVNSFPLC